MKRIRLIRLFGMISIIILFFVYLYLRSLPGADVLSLQLFTMLAGCGISLTFMTIIFILDKDNRKSTLISIILIVVVVIVALLLR